jgi:hypothetical protein
MEIIIGASILLGIVITVIVLIAVSIVVRQVTRAMAPALEERISRIYSPEQIIRSDLRALTLGLESRGVFQARGNGALVLTASELSWFQFMPESNDVRIPRESITKVDTVKMHLGKTYGRDLLRVTFTNNGKPDSMAWLVTDLGAWLSELGQPANSAP